MTKITAYEDIHGHLHRHKEAMLLANLATDITGTLSRYNLSTASVATVLRAIEDDEVLADLFKSFIKNKEALEKITGKKSPVSDSKPNG